jgi:hypothetical protein
VSSDFDVFLCHASEDKASVVDPLVGRLEERGLRVWYDLMQIRVGDSLARRIDEGLARSRYGAVVISPAVLAKETNWVRRELDALAAREAQDGRVVVLPIWHEVSARDVANYSPTLASKLAAETRNGLDRVASEIVAVCQVDVDEASSPAAVALEPSEGEPGIRPFSSLAGGLPAIAFARPQHYMSPPVAGRWPPLLLRAVLAYQPTEGSVAKIGSHIHRNLPAALGSGPLAPHSGVWDISTGAYSSTVFTTYQADLSFGRTAWCGLAMPTGVSSSIMLVVDLGLSDERWPLRLEETSRWWADTLVAARTAAAAVVAPISMPSPQLTRVELHADLAPYVGSEQPTMHDLADAIDFTMLGRCTGQPIQAALWAAAADTVEEMTPLETVMLAWCEQVGDWGFLDPDDGLAVLRSRLGA